MDINKLPIAKEGFVYIITLLIFCIVFYFLFIPVFIVSILLLFFIIFFFRNPTRRIPYENCLIVSPADGKVMSIEEIEESDFILGKAIKVSIFLSIFNVHVNRSPISGEIIYMQYRAGQFLPAFKSHSSDINERNSVGIENEYLKVLVHQITGFIARRIVCWVDKGDKIQKGQRFGIIKFGSRTEIILPSNVDINVKVGDKVKGGCSVIGKINI